MTRMKRFEINLPSGWEDETIYMYRGPDDSGVQHRITLVVDHTSGSDSVDEFARLRIETVMATLQGAEILKEEPKELASGIPAYECVIKWIPVGSDARFVKTVYLLSGGSGYTFSCTFSKKTLKTIGVDMDRIEIADQYGKGRHVRLGDGFGEGSPLADLKILSSHLSSSSPP